MFLEKARSRKEIAALNRIADELEPQLSEAFVAAIEGLQDDVDIAALLDAVESGNIKRIEEALDLPTRLQPVDAVIRAAVEQAGVAFAVVHEAALGVSFDIINPKVVEWMRENSAAMVENISQETLLAVRTVLERAAQDGIHPQTIMPVLGDIVGLDERRANALYNYWAGLNEQGVDEGEIERLMLGYAERLLADRAETIARTEIVHAANEGQQQLWDQAVEAELISAESEQEWLITAGACTICQEIADNGPVGLNESFLDDEGNEYDQPPAHPNCRCAIGLVDGGKAVEKYSPDQPRDDHGRWAGSRSKTPNLDRLLRDIHKPDAGFTHNPVTHKTPHEGFALSIHKDHEAVFKLKELTLTKLAKYTAQNHALLKQKGNYLGAWHNPQDHKVYLDISTVVHSHSEAERLGRQHHQLAYFDLKHGKSVPIKRKS